MMRERNAKEGQERRGQSDFGADARRSHMAAFRFNISISVVAAPTGHRRTPTPKPDCKEGCAAPAKRMDRLTPNMNRASPAPHP